MVAKTEFASLVVFPTSARVEIEDVDDLLVMVQEPLDIGGFNDFLHLFLSPLILYYSSKKFELSLSNDQPVILKKGQKTQGRRQQQRLHVLSSDARTSRLMKKLPKCLTTKQYTSQTITMTTAMMPKTIALTNKSISAELLAEP